MRLVILLVFMAIASVLHAQDEPEYRVEIGAGASLVAYQGDLGGALFKNMQPMGSVVAKYRMNPRTALGLNIGFGKLKGSTENNDSYYPLLDGETIEFSNSMVDASVKFEYNFLPYGTGREYRGAKPLTPYIAVGVGATYVDTSDGSVVAAQVPLGVGVKYKLATRLNLALEWTMHFTLSDKLEGVEDPYGIKSSGLFKNADSYSMLQVSVTYDIWAKCKTCNNDNY